MRVLVSYEFELLLAMNSQKKIFLVQGNESTFTHNTISQNFNEPCLIHSDPYVRIDLNTIYGDINIDSVHTKTKKKTLNPKWEEEFVFRVKPNEHKLVFQVFDENRFTRDDFLGMVELTLVNLPKEQEGRDIQNKTYQLRPRRSVG